MITAMWLIVAIATVAVLFGVEAHERYTLGINASERGVARAAALGALALEQAHLERALRTANAGTKTQRLRSSDPWLDVDSAYTGQVEIDSIPVDVVATTGGTKLNVNQMTEDQLRTFFGYLLNDYSTSDILAQSIMDWRDMDDQARVNGGERDAYLKDHKMVLPANAPFREVDDLLDVRGMTPEILAQARPYLRTYGNSTINLNAADKYVLRAIPGMTDVILQRILALRQNGGRIRNMNDVIPGATGRPGQGGRGGPPPPTPQQALAQRVAANTTVDTQEVEFVISAQAGPSAQPVRLSATVTKQGQNARITWRQW